MTKTTVSLEELLEAGVHFGHQSQRWHPKMETYIYGTRQGVHIFDLVKTKKHLEKAIEFAQKTAAEGKKIIFVGTKRQAKSIIAEEAKKAGFPFVDNRWLGGAITNWMQIKKNLDNLEKMKQDRDGGEFKKYTKKERLLIDREIGRLEKLVGGLAGLEGLPGAIFVVDSRKEKTAVREANAKKIPVIAMVDSNSDPTSVDYVIPANDDAAGSVRLITSQIAKAAGDGRKAWEKNQAKIKKQEAKKEEAKKENN